MDRLDALRIELLRRLLRRENASLLASFASALININHCYFLCLTQIAEDGAAPDEPLNLRRLFDQLRRELADAPDAYRAAPRTRDFDPADLPRIAPLLRFPEINVHDLLADMRVDPAQAADVIERIVEGFQPAERDTIRAGLEWRFRREERAMNAWFGTPQERARALRLIRARAISFGFVFDHDGKDVKGFGWLVVLFTFGIVLTVLREPLLLLACAGAFIWWVTWVLCQLPAVPPRPAELPLDPHRWRPGVVGQFEQPPAPTMQSYLSWGWAVRCVLAVGLLVAVALYWEQLYRPSDFRDTYIPPYLQKDRLGRGGEPKVHDPLDPYFSYPHYPLTDPQRITGKK